MSHPRPPHCDEHGCTVGVVAGTHPCAAESRMTQRQSANLCVCRVGGVVKVDLWSAREVSKCECVPNTPLRPRLPAITGRRSTGVHSATMSMHWSCGASTVLSTLWILVMRLSISTGCPPPLSGRLAVGGNMCSCMFLLVLTLWLIRSVITPFTVTSLSSRAPQ